MSKVFYKLKNEEEIRLLNPILFNITKDKYLTTIFSSKEEIIYQVNKNIEILGFIDYDFSNLTTTTFKSNQDNVTLYFDSCLLSKYFKIQKGMTVIKNPKLENKNGVIELEKLHEGLLKFYDKSENVEIMTGDIKRELTIVGSLKNGLINGKFYHVPTIKKLSLIDTNFKIGSVKCESVLIKNSDIELRYPKKTSLGTKIDIINSRLKSLHSSLDLGSDEEVDFYLENSILESPYSVRLPRGNYLTKNINKYPTRTIYKSNDKAIYTADNYINNLENGYISYEKGKYYVKRK